MGTIPTASNPPDVLGAREAIAPIEVRNGDDSLLAEFPDRRLVAGFEGGAVYTAERGEVAFLIIDCGAMTDFLDPVEDADLLAKLVTVETFASFRDRALRLAGKMRGEWVPLPFTPGSEVGLGPISPTSLHEQGK